MKYMLQYTISIGLINNYNWYYKEHKKTLSELKF